MANSQDVNYPWRVGRKVGRTIYVVYGPKLSDSYLIGVMDNREIAAEAVEAHNARVSAEHLEVLRQAEQHDGFDPGPDDLGEYETLPTPTLDALLKDRDALESERGCE